MKASPASLRRNITFSVGRWFCPIILTLVVTPILIRNLGAESYGILTILNSVVSLSGFFAVGLNDALIRHLSYAQSVQDWESCSRLIRSNLFVFTFASLILVLLGCALSPFLIEDVLRPPSEYSIATQITFVIVMVGFGFSLVAGSYGAVLAGLRRYDLLAVWAICVSVLSRGGQGVVATIRPDLVSVSLWSFGIQILSLTGIILLVRKVVPGLAISPWPFAAAISKLSRFSVYRTLDAVLALGFLQFDRILVGMIVGVESVMYYSVPSSITQMLGHGSHALTSPLLPTTSSLVAQDKLKELQELYYRSTKILAWLVLSGMVVLSFFSDQLLQMWLGTDFAKNAASTFRWLIVGWGILAISAVATNTIYGLGHPKINMQCRFLQTFFSVGGILVFVPLYGLRSAGWGLSIGSFLSAIVICVYVEKSICVRVGSTLRKGLFRPLVIASILAISAWSLRHFVDGVVILLLACIVEMLLAFFLAYILKVITTKELRYIKEGGQRFHRLLTFKLGLKKKRA